ncbi:hypothetical protein HBI56_236970 [Parastagonospora nodorum]|nr:hypothetical protein HBI10_211530 [Parastagonospora nodorum]KAH4029660.1 hypothetical protein HBI13_030840 [Parastagonospora nodorum]KAH4076071.1 hypothetical protein HBH50_000230 [Parastagonospora nodorum]KAH4081900.1 hypothetical protein HBH48_194800 [Parastagonospora nodorum]KAH4092603.1 hypothetical protein HBH46_182460 [Parastagonospora nodorum]
MDITSTESATLAIIETTTTTFSDLATTPIASPTPECFAYPSNYVQNGDFDVPSSGTPFWDITQSPSNGPWNLTRWGATGAWSGSGVGGTWSLSAKTSTGNVGKAPGTISIRQDGIFIPDGTVVDVSASFRPTRSAKHSSSAPYVFTLRFDNSVIDSFKPDTKSSQYSDYRRLTKTMVSVVGDGPHSVELLVQTKGSDNTWIFDADDFTIAARHGPNNMELCSSLIS